MKYLSHNQSLSANTKIILCKPVDREIMVTNTVQRTGIHLGRYINLTSKSIAFLL